MRDCMRELCGLVDESVDTNRGKLDTKEIEK